jgi:hypothetical protein
MIGSRILVFLYEAMENYNKKWFDFNSHKVETFRMIHMTLFNFVRIKINSYLIVTKLNFHNHSNQDVSY